jgi:hypothetical protein
MSEQSPVYSISGAQSGLSDEQTGRTRRYLISMGIRTACVLGAIITPGWPRWVLIAGAVILPYVAVVVANGGRPRTNHAPVETVAVSLDRALPAAPLVVADPPYRDRSAGRE